MVIGRICVFVSDFYFLLIVIWLFLFFFIFRIIWRWRRGEEERLSIYLKEVSFFKSVFLGDIVLGYYKLVILEGVFLFWVFSFLAGWGYLRKSRLIIGKEEVVFFLYIYLNEFVILFRLVFFCYFY